MGGPKLVDLYSSGPNNECNGFQHPNWGRPNKDDKVVILGKICPIE